MSRRYLEDKIADFCIRFKYFFIGWYIPLKYIFYELLFTKWKKVSTDEWRKATGDIAIVTGCNRGIGEQVVKKLLRFDFHVILAVRNVHAGERALERIRESGVNSGSATVRFVDFSSLTSVRKFSKEVLRENDRIDLLINNAAVPFAPKMRTEDSLDNTFQVNYLSSFLLTNLLLPKMVETGRRTGRLTRILNMASVGQYGGDLNFEDLQAEKTFVKAKAYFDAKLAVVASTKYLAKKIDNEGLPVRIYSLHPAITPTSFWDCVSIGSSAATIFKNLLPLEDSSDRVLFGALAPEIETSNGIFLLNSQATKCNPQADDPQIQWRLYTVSMKLCGLDGTLTKY